jgi:hypothetical protein
MLEALSTIFHGYRRSFRYGTHGRAGPIRHGQYRICGRQTLCTYQDEFVKVRFCKEFGSLLSCFTAACADEASRVTMLVAARRENSSLVRAVLGAIRHTVTSICPTIIMMDRGIGTIFGKKKPAAVTTRKPCQNAFRQPL